MQAAGVLGTQPRRSYFNNGGQGQGAPEKGIGRQRGMEGTQGQRERNSTMGA
ncbi:hypothetical protein ACRRTK_004259 [Alexandromys fortis]